jgi:hypothetical protein
MDMGYCQVTDLVLPHNTLDAWFLGVSGCRRPQLCRLARALQIRSFRRVCAGIESSCNVSLARFRQELPKVGPRGLKTLEAQLEAISFWTQFNALVKKISYYTPAQAARLAPPGVRLSKRARHSLSFSLSLFGKSLLPPCACYGAFLNRAASHKESLSRVDNVSPEYLGFCGEMSRRLFRKGWDSSFLSQLSVSQVSGNASFTHTRQEYGPLQEWDSHAQYVDTVLSEEEHPEWGRKARFAEVLSAGKIRPLVICDAYNEVMRPVHKTLYNYISRFPWLLRGSPSNESFPFAMDPGSFVSVDFEAATDNLSVNVAERILGVALSRAQHIPVSLRRYCLASLRPRIYYPSEDEEAIYPEEIELSMGQMMGSLLSFPLLCLQTFFFYLWCEGFTDLKPKELRSFDRCLVNGDDLVFKTEHPENFFNEAETTMSKINRKKTGISDSYFNINSTLFSISKKGILNHVPFIRPAQFDLESPIDLGSRVREATRWLSKRSSLQSRSFEFLMTEATNIARRHGWSLWKSGFRGEKQYSWLKKRGHLRYEADIRSFGQELPAPSPPNDFKTEMIPVPEHLRFLSREDCLQITGVYSAVYRLTCPMPQGREKYSEKKELTGQRRDYKSMLRRLERPKKFLGICFENGRRFPISAPFQGKSFPSFGTRFPLPVEDRIFFSRRSMTAYYGSLLKKIETKERRLLPAALLSFIKDPFVALSCNPIHFYRLEEERGVGVCQMKNFRDVKIHPIAAERVWAVVRNARLSRRLPS